MSVSRYHDDRKDPRIHFLPFADWGRRVVIRVGGGEPPTDRRGGGGGAGEPADRIDQAVGWANEWEWAAAAGSDSKGRGRPRGGVHGHQQGVVGESAERRAHLAMTAALRRWVLE